MISASHNRIIERILRLAHWVNVAVHMISFVMLVLVSTAALLYAAVVSERSDTLTNHSSGADSSHTIGFDLSSTNGFAAGESVIIDFHEDESRFVVDGAGALVADFTFNDGTARTIFSVTNGAASCAGSVGVNDVAVGIANATGIITFTACPSYVASASGATVTIAIGSAAGGSDIITNPGVVGNYVIDITNAGGDCTGGANSCDIGIAIIDGSPVTITAAVTGGSTGGGPAPDNNPPVISDVAVSGITQSSATITWLTSESSTSVVHIGTTVAYGRTIQDLNSTPNHSVFVDSLDAATLYHFQVCSSDGSGNQACSGDFTFTTLDETAPIISNVVVSNITGTSATITWTTDEASTSIVDYGTVAGPPYASTTSDGAFVTSHSVTLTGLTQNTTYHFRVRSADASGNEGVTADATFTTLNTAPPVISAITVTNITETSATVNWTTDIPSDSAVDYGLTVSYGATVSDAALVTSHSLNLVGLTPGTLYHFRVRSTNAFAESTTSSDQTFTTLSDTTGPGPVTNFVATAGNTEILLTWVNPTDPDRAGTRILRKLGSAPTSPTDGVLVYDGVGDSHLDTGLVNGTTYFYTAFAYDASLNFSTGVSTSATPQAEEPEPTAACSDSDGGQNTSLKGTTTDENASFTDICSAVASVQEYYCSADVAQSTSLPCGTGFVCDDGRCISEGVIPPGPQCGNAICESGEDSLSCPADCPVTPSAPPEEEEPPTTVGAADQISSDELVFTATSGNIPLELKDEQLTVYPSMAFSVIVPAESLAGPVSSAEIRLGDSAFAMTVGPDGLRGVVLSPSEIGLYPMSIVITYEDGTIDVIEVSVNVVAPGRVLSNTTGEPIAGAEVLINVFQDGEFILFDADATGQRNPFIVDADGRYRFILPAGRYQFIVSANGFRTLETLPVVEEGGVTVRDFRLIPLPGDSIAEQVGFIVDVITQDVTEVINNPEVEDAVENIATPIVVIVAAANVIAAGAAAATLIPYLLSLLSFLAQPFGLFGRRRRKQWGVVYNSLTKLPIDLAIIRLLDPVTDKVIRSFVTDKEGRYFFIVQPGKYRISVMKEGFVFPSALLRDAREDAQYADVYHGEEIVVREETTLTANIPVDPVVMDRTPRRIVVGKVMRKAQKILALLSVFALGIAAVISPTPFVIGMAITNFVFYLIFRRLAVTKPPKSWGVVYDPEGKPVSNVIARIFDTRFNKLLETQVTDLRGRYSFLVGRNEYYVTYEKPGFAKEEFGPVDLSKKSGDSQTIGIDVHLKKSTGK